MCQRDSNTDIGLLESEKIVKKLLKGVKEEFDVNLNAHIFRNKIISNHIVTLFEFTNGYDVMFESDIKYFLYKDGTCLDLSLSDNVLELKLI